MGEANPPQAATIHEDPASKVRKAAFDRLKQLKALEIKVIRGEKAGAIHDFRVASRRLEQAILLLAPAEAPAAHRRLRRKLARGRKALSGVRNYDVLLGRASKMLARKRASRREAWKAIQDYVRDERRAKHS
ncbi:MAG: CHAD domain-containing protein, partial [Acidobacteriota bacterium]|nr:CHAD domain-containing protein [Acidobacteriota bacterium]